MKSDVDYESILNLLNDIRQKEGSNNASIESLVLTFIPSMIDDLHIELKDDRFKGNFERLVEYISREQYRINRSQHFRLKRRDLKLLQL